MIEKPTFLSFIKNLLIYLLYIIIIPIIIYDLFLIVQTIIRPGVTPDFFGIKTFSIVSGSMEPTINIDDIVIIKKVDKKELTKDDIISFRINNEIITHRIIDKELKNGILFYITKGDNNEVPDIHNVKYSQIEGKYIGKIPKAGKILTLLKNKKIFFTIIILLILSFILQRKKIKRKIERKAKREKFEKSDTY